MKDIKVVVFDCDGVMFDTADANRAYYDGILKHFGREPMNEEQFRYTHMQTVSESLKHLFSDLDNLDEIQEYRKTIPYESLIRYMVMEPGLKELLARLRPMRKTAIATNRMNTMPIVIEEHGLQNLFDLVIMASHVENPKPAPDMLHKITDHFDLTPKEGVFIGDSVLDSMAAEAAGMTFIAYKNPELSADFHVSGFDEVEKLLF